MKINIKQILFFLIFAPILFALFSGFPFGDNVVTILFHLILDVLILYLFIRTLWLLGTPTSEDVLFKESIWKELQAKRCPLCGSNKDLNSYLDVGYRKRKYYGFQYKIFYLKYSTSQIEPTIKVIICDSCRQKYFTVCKHKAYSLFYINPSIKLLKRKYGFLRGLKFPYEEWNVS